MTAEAHEPGEEKEPRVTFVWPDRGRTGILHVMWQKGRTVQQYLHMYPLRQTALLGRWRKLRCVNAKREKVRLRYVPVPGDVIVAMPVPRAG